MGRHPSGGAGTGQAKMGSQAGGGGEPRRLPGQAGFQPHQGRCHRVKRGLGWRGGGEKWGMKTGPRGVGKTYVQPKIPLANITGANTHLQVPTTWQSML